MSALPLGYVAAATATALGIGIAQHARLLTLTTAQPLDLVETLVVERMQGHEAINQDFFFDIDALSVSTDLDLNQFLGAEMTLRLLQADGSRRAWHGYCTQAAWIGADGGLARYRLRLGSFLAFLGMRRDSFIFQDLDATEIVSALLADYPQANLALDVRQPLPRRPICTQHRETDLAFLRRLLASEGLNWRFTHLQDAAQADAQDDAQTYAGVAAHSVHARHQLVIFDSAAELLEMRGGAAIRFHRVAATEVEDAITDFQDCRMVRANVATRSSWDPVGLHAVAGEEQGSAQGGELPLLPVYEGSGERGLADADHAARLAQLGLQALERDSQTFTGAGAARQCAAGCRFTLTQHDRYGEGMNRFTVLSVTHAARNNLGSGAGPSALQARVPVALAQGGASDWTATHSGSLQEAVDAGTYRNQFTCVREHTRIVPAALAAPPIATASGSQSALVVGLPGTAITTERDHRIKVQFAWQRGASPNPGGGIDTGNPVDRTGNAPGNDASGAWVRVAEALAGPNWGTQFIARLEAEVLLDFAAGDIDRPLVVGQLYNGRAAPPFAAGIGTDVEHAGVVSGWHSRTLDGGGFNQWVVDDSCGRLRMRLASSSAASQANFGTLVAQAPNSARRGAYRGAGFELHTDAWAVLRGGDGVLLSTAARPQAGPSVQDTQMATAEALAQLRGAQHLLGAMTTAAVHQNALSSASAQGAHESLIQSIDPAAKGHHPDSVNGQSAFRPGPGSRTLDPAQPVERFAAPIVMLDAPASINWASPASTVVFAGQALQWTSQGDWHWAAGHTFSSVTAQATSFFTHAGGIQAIAANGPVSLQAHTDALDLLADQAITVTSVNAAIEIQAARTIVLQAGQSSLTLDGGDITFACPGKFSVKGALHGFADGERNSAELSKLPDTTVKFYDEAFALHDPTGVPMANAPYSIDGADGKITDRSSVDGRTVRTGTQTSDQLSFAMRWHVLDT